MFQRRWSGVTLALTLILPIGCAPISPPQPLPLQTEECGATDSRVGQTAQLRTLFHNVSGTARIVNDCTIAIEHFTYDGGGLDVRVYGGRDLSFQNGVILSSDLRRPGGYQDEKLTLTLPAGVTLDDVRAIAIWCIVVNADFGDAAFQ